MSEDARLIIELEARMDKLTAGLSKANASLYAFSSNAQKQLGTANSAWEKLFAKGDAAKALDRVIDRSRLGLLQAGSSQLRVFGSAFEPLGAYGVAAAAGVAAFGGAVTAAIKAADWAEELKRTADTIGLSTTALQQFDYVADATGVPIDTMREALSGLNQKIGDVQSNLVRAKGLQVKAFQALLGPNAAQQLRDLGTLSNILPVIAEKLRALPAAEREGIAAKLNIAPILPALESGAKGIAALQAEASKAGAVVSEELIEKGAVAAENMKKLGDVVKGNLSAAFLDLIPNIHAAATAIGDFLRTMTFDLQISEQELGDFGRLWLDMANLRLSKIPGDAGKLWDTTSGGPVRPPQYDDDTILAMINAKFAGHPTAKQLVPDAVKKGRKGHDPHDDTIEQGKAADDALFNAERQLADAYKALTDDAQARATFETAANVAESDKKVADLKEQHAKLMKDQGIEGPASDIADAKITQAIADVRLAQLAKQELIDRTADIDERKKNLALKDEEDGYYRQTNDILAAMATTLKARHAFETENLAREQEAARLKLQLEADERLALAEAIKDQDRRTNAINEALGTNHDLLARQTELQSAQQGQLQQQQYDQSNPLAAFGRQATETYGNLNTDMQDAAVKGIESFNQGLVDAIVNFKSLQDVGVQALKAIESALLQALLNRMEGQLIGMMFGAMGGGFSVGGSGSAVGSSMAGLFADGGKITGPGTSKSDSILARVSNGERIMTAEAESRFGPLLEKMNANPRGFAAGGLVGSVSSMGAVSAGRTGGGDQLHFHLEGAVVTEELLSQVNQIGQMHGDRAVATSLRAGKAALPGQLRSRKLLSD